MKQLVTRGATVTGWATATSFCLYDKHLVKMQKKQEAQKATYRAPEYNVPPLWEIGQGRHFC